MLNQPFLGGKSADFDTYASLRGPLPPSLGQVWPLLRAPGGWRDRPAGAPAHGAERSVRLGYAGFRIPRICSGTKYLGYLPIPFFPGILLENLRKARENGVWKERWLKRMGNQPLEYPDLPKFEFVSAFARKTAFSGSWI